MPQWSRSPCSYTRREENRAIREDDSERHIRRRLTEQRDQLALIDPDRADAFEREHVGRVVPRARPAVEVSP